MIKWGFNGAEDDLVDTKIHFTNDENFARFMILSQRSLPQTSTRKV